MEPVFANGDCKVTRKLEQLRAQAKKDRVPKVMLRIQGLLLSLEGKPTGALAQTLRVHRSTACTLSGALWAEVGVRFFRSVFSGRVLVEVICKFLFVVLLITDTEFESALLGAEHDGLPVHPADHVEGRLRFAAQGQLQEVVLNAGFDGLAQLRLNLEEAISRRFNAER